MEQFSSQQEVVECLCELFVEVDIDGDGLMAWEEFTAFIIDNNMVDRDTLRVDGIKNYMPVCSFEPNALFEAKVVVRDETESGWSRAERNASTSHHL